MRECHFRPFRDEFLQGSYRGFEVVSIDIALRFVEHVVEWIRYLLLPGLRLPFRWRNRVQLARQTQRTQKKARLAQAIQLPAIENASWFDFGNAGSICNCSRVAC